MKPWYISKLVITNLIIIVLAYWFRYSTFYVDPMYFIWVIAAVNIYLRFKTKGPLRPLRVKKHHAQNLRDYRGRHHDVDRSDSTDA